MSGDGGRQLQFAPFSSCVNPAFWSVLAAKKLEVIGLDESPVPVKGFFSINDVPGVPATMNVGWDAFGSKLELPLCSYEAHGTVVNKNTVESFKACDKKLLLDEEGQRLQEIIKSKEALKKPGCLNRFVLLMYADLKKYLFFHWFAFPEAFSLRFFL